MSDKVQIEDPPDPDLSDLQQRDLPFPTVDVRVADKVRVQPLPARAASAEVFPLTTLQARVFGQDWKRCLATMISNVAWQYSLSSSGSRIPWPANVPLVITHCQAVYASVATDSGNLSVLTESYAD